MARSVNLGVFGRGDPSGMSSRIDVPSGLSLRTVHRVTSFLSSLFLSVRGSFRAFFSLAAQSSNHRFTGSGGSELRGWTGPFGTGPFGTGPFATGLFGTGWPGRATTRRSSEKKSSEKKPSEKKSSETRCISGTPFVTREAPSEPRSGCREGGVLRAVVAAVLTLAVWLAPQSVTIGDELTGAALFHDIWRQEVVRGELSAAADRYTKSYASASTTLSPAYRRKAAYRAGRCYEAVGEPRLAERAYRWLLERGQRDEELVSAAESRLRWLSSGGYRRAARGDESPRRLERPEFLGVADLSARDAAHKLWERYEELSNVYRRLHEATAAAEDRREASMGLLAVLDERGFELVFDDVSYFRDSVLDGPPQAPRDSKLFRAWVDDDDVRSQLRRVLRESLYDRALKAAVGEDSAAARRFLSAAYSVDGTFVATSALVQLTRSGRAPSIVARLARRELDDRHERRVAVLRHELARALRTARSTERKDRELFVLWEALRRLQWERSRVLADLEIAALRESLRSRFVTVLPELSAFLAQYWDWSLSATSHVVRRSEALVEATTIVERYGRRPARTMSPGRAGAIRDELWRLRRAYEELQQSGEGDDRELRRAHWRIRSLKAWFPDLER